MTHPQSGRRTRSKPGAREGEYEKIDFAQEFINLETMLKRLKIEYEKYFLGLVRFQPHTLHKQLKRLLQTVREAPFKQPRDRYRLRNIESDYQTLNSYWKRVLREKEAGTYARDIRRAELKELYQDV